MMLDDAGCCWLMLDDVTSCLISFHFCISSPSAIFGKCEAGANLPSFVQIEILIVFQPITHVLQALVVGCCWTLLDVPLLNPHSSTA